MPIQAFKRYMKLFVNCIILLIVAYHASGQVDTRDKEIKVRDSLQNRMNISMNNLLILSNGSFVHFRADSIKNNKRQSLFFYNSNIYKPTHCQNFWITAAPILFSFLAEQTKHQYFYRPGK